MVAVDVLDVATFSVVSVEGFFVVVEFSVVSFEVFIVVVEFSVVSFEGFIAVVEVSVVFRFGLPEVVVLESQRSAPTRQRPRSQRHAPSAVCSLLGQYRGGFAGIPQHTRSA